MKKVSFVLMTMRFYVRDGRVVAVEGPTESEPIENFDAESYTMPEPLGYSPAMSAVVWSLALFAERHDTTWRLISRHRIYPHPWYTIWRTPLELLMTAQRRLGNPEVGVEPGLRPQIDEAIDLILTDIARRAYEAYLVYRQSFEADADDEIRRVVEGDDNGIRPDEAMFAQTLAPLLLSIVDRVSKPSS